MGERRRTAGPPAMSNPEYCEPAESPDATTYTIPNYPEYAVGSPAISNQPRGFDLFNLQRPHGNWWISPNRMTNGATENYLRSQGRTR